MRPEFLRNLKLTAMASVVKEPGDYTIRFIFRWYSREFSTPLHLVETFPLEDVLRHYFECQYEDLAEQDREQEIERLLISPEKLTEARRKEDAEDADAWEFGKMVEAETPKMPPSAPLPDPIEERLQKIRDELKPPVKFNDAETALPGVKEPIPEGIHMSFEDVEVDIPDAPSFGPKTG